MSVNLTAEVGIRENQSFMRIPLDIHDDTEQIKATFLEDKCKDQQVETWSLVVEKGKHGTPLCMSKRRRIMDTCISYVLQDPFTDYL